MVSGDVALHWTVRALAAATLALFLVALLSLNGPAFLGAIWSGAMAYLLLRVDVERHAPPADADVRVDGTKEPPTEADAKAIYPFQAAGIPLTYEKRSPRARKKGG